MATINARSKGGRGEREFCKWLLANLELDNIPERNLEQVREGGSDIINIPPFSFEVKRQEKLNLRHWWVQVWSESLPNTVPVVAYRKNHQPWRFLISAQNVGVATGFVQLEEQEFKIWANQTHNKWVEWGQASLVVNDL